MQAIKTHADALGLLEKPVDDDDFIDRILEGLGKYKSVIDAINARDTPTSFTELHEKLLNKQANYSTISLITTYLPRQILQPPKVIQFGDQQ